MDWKHQSLLKLCFRRLCKAVDYIVWICMCALTVDEPLFWAHQVEGNITDALNRKPLLYCPGDKYSMASLNLHQLFFNLCEMYTFYRCKTGELAECWKQCFHVLSLFMRVQPQAMTTWQILFRVLSPEQGMHNFSDIAGTSGLDAIFVGEALLYDGSFPSSYKLR